MQFMPGNQACSGYFKKSFIWSAADTGYFHYVKHLLQSD